MRLRRLLIGLTLGLALSTQYLHAADPTTVIVVRHAEKTTAPSDPPLTEAGKKRALALAHVAGSAQPAAIFVSEFQRTQQTAAPLAAQLHLTPIQHPAADTVGLVGLIRSSWSGRTVVVCAHSNTVPVIVQALTGTRMADIPDGEFDNLFVVVADGGGGTVTHLKYGAPTP